MKSVLAASAAVPGLLFADGHSAYISSVEIPPCYLGGAYDLNGQPCGFALAVSESEVTPDQQEAGQEYCSLQADGGEVLMGWTQSPKQFGLVSKIVTVENGLEFDISLPLFRFTPECSEPGKEIQ